MSVLIKSANIVNEGNIFRADVLIEDGIISGVGEFTRPSDYKIVDADGKYLFPGVIFVLSLCSHLR